MGDKKSGMRLEMNDEQHLIEKIFTAARRYVYKRMSNFDGLKPERGGVFTPSAELLELNNFMDVMPRMQFLSGVRWEVIALQPSGIASLGEARDLLNIAAEICLNFCLKAGSDNEIASKALHEEFNAFIGYCQSLDIQILRTVEPLPYMRALPVNEYEARLKSFGERWGIDMSQGWFPRDYYPAAPISRNLPPIVAFDAHAIVDADGTPLIQRLLRDNGVNQIYIFEESYPAIECEVSHLDLARAIPHIVSYIFSDSLDWMIHTS